MRDVSIDAVVVRSMEYRERDRILTLLSADYGRVDVLARGAKSSQKRFGGHIELFNRVEAVVRRGAGSLSTLTDCRATDTRSRLRTDVLSIAFASYAAELATMAAGEWHADPDGAGWLERALVSAERNAATSPPAPWMAVAEKAERTFLRVQGWLPNLSRCPRCAHAFDAIEARWLACPELEPLCAACRGTAMRVIGVPAPYSPPGPWRAAWAVAIAHHLGRAPRSAEFFESMVPPA